MSQAGPPRWDESSPAEGGPGEGGRGPTAGPAGAALGTSHPLQAARALTTQRTEVADSLTSLAGAPFSPASGRPTLRALNRTVCTCRSHLRWEENPSCRKLVPGAQSKHPFQPLLHVCRTDRERSGHGHWPPSEFLGALWRGGDLGGAPAPKPAATTVSEPLLLPCRGLPGRGLRHQVPAPARRSPVPQSLLSARSFPSGPSSRFLSCGFQTSAPRPPVCPGCVEASVRIAEGPLAWRVKAGN